MCGSGRFYWCQRAEIAGLYVAGLSGFSVFDCGMVRSVRGSRRDRMKLGFAHALPRHGGKVRLKDDGVRPLDYVRRCPVIGGGVRDDPSTDEAMPLIDCGMFLVAEDRTAMSRLCSLPSSSTLTFENFTAQRASRSFCRSFETCQVPTGGCFVLNTYALCPNPLPAGPRCHHAGRAATAASVTRSVCYKLCG